jgi:parallel beta-helix repeat protein
MLKLALIGAVMKRTALTTVLRLLVPLVSVMLLLQLNPSLYVGAQIPADSTITSDTTWDKTSSPYTLTAPVTISSGSTLTIEAGVQVNLNGNYLQADGALVAKGSSTEKVYLSGGSLILNSNSRIEHAVVSNNLQITVNSSSPSISHSQIDSRIIVKGGKPVISNNILSDGIHADATGGPVTINNNHITSRSGSAVVYVQGIHADISGNTIVGNNNMGIKIYHIISSASISDNKISNCSYGLHLFTGPGEIDVSQNAIFNNTVGIYDSSNMVLKYNTIVYNEIGLQSSHYCTVENNNFLNNSCHSLENRRGVELDAYNNWWGTTNASLIRSMISGKVIFQPFLTKPNSKTPAIPAESLTTPTPPPTLTPTPTTLPEPFQTTPLLIIGVVGVILAAGSGLLFYFKKRKR